MENITVKQIEEDLSKIQCFKSPNININTHKNIIDIFVKITLNYTLVEDTLNNIEDLDYVRCEFGIFEIFFPIDKYSIILKELIKSFN